MDDLIARTFNHLNHEWRSQQPGNFAGFAPDRPGSTTWDGIGQARGGFLARGLIAESGIGGSLAPGINHKLGTCAPAQDDELVDVHGATFPAATPVLVLL